MFRLTTVALGLTTLLAQQPPPAQGPTFKSGTQVVSLFVTVLDPQQRLVASRAKHIEDSLVFRAHTRPKARKRRHVKVLPVAETALAEHTKASHPGGPAHICPNDVMGMLPIAHRRVCIIMHSPAAGRSYLVEPPVV